MFVNFYQIIAAGLIEIEHAVLFFLLEKLKKFWTIHFSNNWTFIGIIMLDE